MKLPISRSDVSSCAGNCRSVAQGGIARIAVDDRQEHKYGIGTESGTENRSVGSMPTQKKRTGAADEVNVTNVKVLPISNSNVQLEIGNIETGNISTLATFNFQLEPIQGPHWGRIGF